MELFGLFKIINGFIKMFKGMFDLLLIIIIGGNRRAILCSLIGIPIMLLLRNALDFRNCDGVS